MCKDNQIIPQAHTVQVLRLLIKLYESVPEPDWVNICQCLMFLDDSQEVAKILHNLIKGDEVRLLLFLVFWMTLSLGILSLPLQAGNASSVAMTLPCVPAGQRTLGVPSLL